MSTQDAVKVAEAGATAIVVSNHGGAVLDYAAPPLHILPEIVAELDGRMPILVDSGFVRGTDVFKALALGASGVMMGRVLMAALARGGAGGVALMLKGLTAELKRVMSITGCPNVKGIDPEILHSSYCFGLKNHSGGCCS